MKKKYYTLVLLPVLSALFVLASCADDADDDRRSPDSAPGTLSVTPPAGQKPTYQTDAQALTTRTATTPDGSWQRGDVVTLFVTYYADNDALQPLSDTDADLAPARATHPDTSMDDNAPAGFMAHQAFELMCTAAANAATPAEWNISPATHVLPYKARSFRARYVYRGLPDVGTTTVERITADVPLQLISAPSSTISLGGTEATKPKWQRRTALILVCDLPAGESVTLTCSVKDAAADADTPAATANASAYAEPGTIYRVTNNTNEPCDYYFHLPATADDDPSPLPTFCLYAGLPSLQDIIARTPATAYNDVAYSGGWRFSLAYSAIRPDSSSDTDLQGTAVGDGSQELDPMVFNFTNPKWIVTGKETKYVKEALERVATTDGYTGVIELTMPEVESIGKETFRSCSALKSVSLPVAKSIGESAFEGCKALRSISLPAVIQVDDAEGLSTTAFSQFPNSGNCNLVLNSVFSNPSTPYAPTRIDGSTRWRFLNCEWQNISFGPSAATSLQTDCKSFNF